MFCHTRLGANEAIEHFQVGRRLAFDAAKGRLWVVCSACERWNLSPIDERWEAIEECERLFRETRLRVSTDNIGLAKLREGTTLIRVGDPQRPEMAAWRYGDQFHRRRRKHLAWVAGGAVAVGGLVVAGPILGLISGAAIFQVPNLWNVTRLHTTRARVILDGRVLKLSGLNLIGASLKPNEGSGFVVEFRHKKLRNDTPYRFADRSIVLHGDQAIRVARQLLPRINRAGGRQTDIADAVGVLEMARSTDHLFSLTASAAKMPAAKKFRYHGLLKDVKSDGSGAFSSMPTAVRLALEMSLHEEDERRALAGELAALEDRWREAEEVAAISDDMFMPTGVGAMLKRLKGSSD